MNSAIPLPEGWSGLIYREWNFPVELIKKWRAMAREYGDFGIFLDYDWFTNWWHAFGGDQEPLIIVIQKDEEPKGIFPCSIKRGPQQTSGHATISSLTNEHTCHYDFLIDADELQTVLLMFIQLVRKHFTATGMHFNSVRTSSPNIRLFTDLLHANRVPYHQYSSPRTPWMNVRAAAATKEKYELFLGQLPSRLCNTIRRCRKKAESLGPLSFEVYSEEPFLDKALDIMFNVEYRSWKGRNSTAIKCDAKVEQFYSDYAHSAATRGRLLLFLLRINGVPVAADYCLRSSDTIFLIKSGYDESFGHLSPGNLLRSEVFKYLADKTDCSIYNFLGARDPWKMEWAQETNEYGFIRVFPKTVLGWGSYAVSYGWKNYLKRYSAVSRFL